MIYKGIKSIDLFFIRVVIITLFLIIADNTAFAQSILNEKSYYDSLVPKKIIGDVGFGVNINDEGTRNVFIQQNAALSYASNRHLYELSNDLYFNQNGTDPASNRLRTLLRVALFRQQFAHERISQESDFFPELITSFMYDESRGLNYRANLYAGLTYNLHTISWGRLKLGSGLMYEKESWRIFEKEFLPTFDTLSPGIKQILKDAFGIDSKGNIVKDNWRWSTYLQCVLDINERVNISATGSIQAPLQVAYHNPLQVSDFPVGDKKYPRITLDLSVSFDLSTKLRFYTNFFLQKDEGQISPFAKKLISNLSQGLSYRF